MRLKVFFAALWILITSVPALAQEVTLHIFWQEGCPYCEAAKEHIAKLAADDADLIINPLELGPDKAINGLFAEATRALGIRTPAVPLVVVGARYEQGFAKGRTPQTYDDMIRMCRSVPCRDLIAELQQASAPITPPPAAATPAGPGSVTLPWGTELSLKGLSLPVLTVVLAAVDGFNPCAMWVLALLIGLLLGVQDTRRMWTLGIVFLLATGAMYFAVMSAWLNVVLWIGAVMWLRLAIGALALGAGVFYLREYWTNPDGVCKVTPGNRKRQISLAFRRMVEQPSLLAAAFGVALLAIAVNLVELVCSAGVPAIYTQMLSMQDLTTGGYYGYLLLYLAVFLFDDTALFVIAMITLRSVASTGRFSRISHLIGGIVLLVLGALMVLRPDLLG